MSKIEDIVFPWAWDEEQKIAALAKVIANGDLPKLLNESPPQTE